MRRIGELDAVRGLGAIWVMLYHLWPGSFGPQGVRVDLFFVLSGYLVTAILLRKKDTDYFVPIFWLRRGIRIVPIYYLAIACMLLANRFQERPLPIAGLPYYLTFTQNLPLYWKTAPPPFLHYFGHTWSLAIEEQFYVIWPLLLRLTGGKRLVPMALGLLTSSVVARACGVDWWLLVGRCDGFALGGVLAVLFADLDWVGRHRKILNRGLSLLMLGALALFATCYSWREGTQFFSAMSLWPSLTVLAVNLAYASGLGLIVLHSGHRYLGPLRSRWLGAVGSLSYGLYLYHPLVFMALFSLGRKSGIGDPFWLQGVKIAVALGVAALSMRYLEKPLEAVRDRHASYGAGLFALGRRRRAALQTAEA